MTLVASDANYTGDAEWGALASAGAADEEGCYDRVAAAVAALQQNQADTVLLQGGEYGAINDADVEKLTCGLAGNSAVTYIDLSMNQIGDAGLASLAPVVGRMESLMDLRIDGNHFGGDGMEALCEALRDHRGLTKLDVSSNDLGCGGIVALAATLRSSEQILPLLSLHLRGVGLGDASATDLLDAIQNHSQLTALHISGNDLTDASAAALCRLIAESPTLLDLNAANNAFTNDGVTQIVDTICATKTLLTAQLSRDGKRYNPPMLKECLAQNRAKAEALQRQYQEAAFNPHPLATHYSPGDHASSVSAGGARGDAQYDDEVRWIQQQQQHDEEKQVLHDEIAYLREQLSRCSQGGRAPDVMVSEPTD